MRLFVRVITFVNLLVILVQMNTSAATIKADNALLNKIDQYVTNQFENNKVVGGAYAIVSGDKIMVAKGIGVTDLNKKQPATEKTIYSTASVTKIFTATAILQLYEKGLIDLYAPVQKYLSWFTYQDETRSTKITIRNLLTHSSGITRFEGDGVLFQNEKKNRDSLEHTVKALRFARMSYDPGTKVEYCNSCYNTLGLIIKEVTGMDYEQYIEEHLFSTLNLKSTTFSPDRVQPLASEYNWVFGFKQKSEFNNVVFGKSQNPQGGIYSNVLDLSRLLSALMGESETKMLKDQTLALSQSEELPSLDSTRYSISGLEETEIAGERLLYKSGDGIGSGSMIMMIPKKKLGIVVLAGESISEFAGPVAVGIAKQLLGDAPDQVNIKLTFWKLVGIISLSVTIISTFLIAILFISILEKRKSHFAVKRKGWVTLCGIICTVFASLLIVLIINIHPSQIGFYGYPYDLAIGIISLITALSLWGVFNFILLLNRRKSILHKLNS